MKQIEIVDESDSESASKSKSRTPSDDKPKIILPEEAVDDDDEDEEQILLKKKKMKFTLILKVVANLSIYQIFMVMLKYVLCKSVINIQK